MLDLSRSRDHLWRSLLLLLLLLRRGAQRLELYTNALLLLFLGLRLLLETAFAGLLATLTHDLLLQLVIVLTGGYGRRGTLLFRRWHDLIRSSKSLVR